MPKKHDVKKEVEIEYDNDIDSEDEEIPVHDTGDELKDMIANLNELPTEVLEQLLHNLEEIEKYNKAHPESIYGDDEDELDDEYDDDFDDEDEN